MEEVFGDHELGAAILDLERGNVADARDALGRIIAERYIGEADVIGPANRKISNSKGGLPRSPPERVYHAGRRSVTR